MTAAMAGKAVAGRAAGRAAAGQSTKGAAVQKYLAESAADDPARPIDPPTGDGPPRGPDGRFRPSTDPAPAKAPAKKATAAKKAPAKKRPAKKRRAPLATEARRARRQIEAPVRRQISSGLVVVGLGVLVAVLYQALTNAGAASAVIEAPGAALRWLRDPVPIPYRHR